MTSEGSAPARPPRLDPTPAPLLVRRRPGVLPSPLAGNSTPALLARRFEGGTRSRMASDCRSRVRVWQLVGSSAGSPVHAPPSLPVKLMLCLRQQAPPALPLTRRAPCWRSCSRMPAMMGARSSG